MTIWKELLPIVLVLLLLTACGMDSKSIESDSANDTKSSESDSANDISTTRPALAKDLTEPAITSFSEGDVGDDTPIQWPADLMGDILPVPSGVLTSIDTGSSFFGDAAPDYITVVSFRNMSRTDCEMYVNKLVKLGFTDYVTEQDAGDKMVYTGSMENEGCGVTFEYYFDEEKGFVSYNPMIDNTSIDSWPSDEMGDLPDPGCALVAFSSEGTDDIAVCTVEFANMKEPEANAYISELKALGYVTDTDASSDETILFRGFNANGKGVIFQYSIMYENGIISYGPESSLTGC